MEDQDDRMIEEALTDQFSFQYTDISDYIRWSYKLIKLHGSVNWAREVHNPLQSLQGNDNAILLREIIDRAASLQISGRYHLVGGYPSIKAVNAALFPAIAIPVEVKNTFECPHDHVEALTSLIPSVDKVLIVGWRASEQHFLQLLKNNVRKPIKVMIVNGHPDYGNEPIEKFQRAGITADFVKSSAGFTRFIVEREGESFFRS